MSPFERSPPVKDNGFLLEFVATVDGLSSDDHNPPEDGPESLEVTKELLSCAIEWPPELMSFDDRISFVVASVELSEFHSAT